MGLSKGHTFTDGETVTAAKLNNLVDNATITSDTVTTAMIQDNAVTADKLATDAVTGANIASNSINLTSLSNASGGTSGTIVQSGAGGVFEEFTPGTSGTFLKSAGTDASLTWGTVDATGVDATMISGHTEITSPGTDDTLLIKDKAAGVNKSLQIQNLYKTVSGLTAITDADVVSADEHLIIDGGVPKKITQGNLESSVLKSINGLSSLDDTTVADDDVMLVYDTSASAVKKIAKADLGTGGGLREVQTNFTVAHQGSSISDTITTTPTSSDSGVLVVYGINNQTYDHTGDLTVTLPDAANYVSEGVKTLTILVCYRIATSADVRFSLSDSDGNLVFVKTFTNLTIGSFIQCIPFVSGTFHYWTVRGYA